MFGSAGGVGGSYSGGSGGGAGGNGGGIVYIAANSINVSGGINANGGAGAVGTRGGGGGGAGGSVKLVGGSLTLGSSLVTASSGSGAGSTTTQGGNGGVGRIAVGASSSLSGSTSPAYTSLTQSYNPFAIYVSQPIHTPGTTAFNNIQWTENLPSGTEIEMQTRSGNSTDSTDGTWETWKPTTTSTTINDANTHTDWTGTNATVAEGDVSRNVDYFEDEDEANSGNLTKVTATAASGYAERTISSTDLSTYQYITLWLRSAQPGQVITLGFGEAAATEQTKTINIDNANAWQKVYWDISSITGTARDGVTKFRITNVTNGNVIWFDNILAQSYLTTAGGSTITSTANNYIQYRAIMTTTNNANSPTLSLVKINLTNANGTYTVDADSIVDPNATVRTQTSRRTDPSILEYSMYSTGTGADGSVTFSASTNLNETNSGTRTCTDGGDAVSYSVTTLNSTSAVLEQNPAAGCLNVGDEVLVINLRGTNL
jgi:hypothetical protein